MTSHYACKYYRFQCIYFKSHSFESFFVCAKVLLRFQLIFCAFFLWNNDFQFLIFSFVFLLISGVRYTNEIKSNGSVDRTNSDTIGFKWIIPGTLTMVIISDSILIRSPVLYIWKFLMSALQTLLYFLLSRLVLRFVPNEQNKEENLEDKDEARVMTSWLCANWRTDQSLDEEKLSHLGLKFKEIKFVIERWIGFVLLRLMSLRY